MNLYELVVLLHPDLEIDVDAPVAKIEKLVENAGGKVVKRDNWGKKRLAYKIKGQGYAVYVLFEVQLPAANARGLEGTILLTEEVMRHLLVAKEPAVAARPQKPKAAKAAAEPAAAAEDKQGESNG
ncbi:30S ribosomal protein S6 [Candidatus Parcubacteria bacterium]|nr:30S ribosomal protein S6 [Candidatus Parcubacteria bacterium]